MKKNIAPFMVPLVNTLLNEYLAILLSEKIEDFECKHLKNLDFEIPDNAVNEIFQLHAEFIQQIVFEFCYKNRLDIHDITREHLTFLKKTINNMTTLFYQNFLLGLSRINENKESLSVFLGQKDISTNTLVLNSIKSTGSDRHMQGKQVWILEFSDHKNKTCKIVYKPFSVMTQAMLVGNVSQFTPAVIDEPSTAMSEDVSSTRLLPDINYQYSDADISLCNIAQFRRNRIQYVAGKTFLLNGPANNFFISKETGIPYLTLVTDGVDTIGIGTPICYFFDKSLQPQNTICSFLTEILKVESELGEMSQMQAPELEKKLMSILSILTNDIQAIKIATRELRNCEFNSGKIKNKIAQLKTLSDRIDVFDELMPIVKPREECHVRVLFPYNITQIHWLCGEVLIHFKNNQYQVQVFTHDPYGGGQMSEQNFLLLKDVIEKKIKEHDRRAIVKVNVNKERSSYEARQRKCDVSSCGVIVVDDLYCRVLGKSLDRRLFKQGAAKLRQTHCKLVDRECKSEFKRRVQQFCRDATIKKSPVLLKNLYQYRDIKQLMGQLSLLELFNSMIEEPGKKLKLYTVLPLSDKAGEYGFVEFLEYGPWPSNKEVLEACLKKTKERIFEPANFVKIFCQYLNEKPPYVHEVDDNFVNIFNFKRGMLAAISHLVGLSDLHCENCLVIGSDTFIIDPEGCFNVEKVDPSLQELYSGTTGGFSLKSITKIEQYVYHNNEIDELNVYIPSRNLAYQMLGEQLSVVPIDPEAFMQGVNFCLEIFAKNSNLFQRWLHSNTVLTMPFRYLPTDTGTYDRAISEAFTEYQFDQAQVLKVVLPKYLDPKALHKMKIPFEELTYELVTSNELLSHDNIHDELMCFSVPKYFLMLASSDLINFNLNVMKGFLENGPMIAYFEKWSDLLLNDKDFRSKFLEILHKKMLQLAKENPKPMTLLVEQSKGKTDDNDHQGPSEGPHNEDGSGSGCCKLQ